jgi:hypothetical protein
LELVEGRGDWAIDRTWRAAWWRWQLQVRSGCSATSRLAGALPGSMTEVAWPGCSAVEWWWFELLGGGGLPKAARCGPCTGALCLLSVSPNFDLAVPV